MPPEIRHLEGLDDFTAAVAFQESIWGEGFSERVPKSLMKVARRLGGVVAGAFEGDRMVGFVFGLTGIVDGHAVHWSDILAVDPGVRDVGLGRQLKRFQREGCLAMGVTRMHWTFDPLESRNAYLNLGRLGAVVREYVPDMYGSSDSPLHRGLGTDRFVVTWEMDSERVERRLAGEPPPFPGDDGTVRAFEASAAGPLAPGRIDDDWMERAAEAGRLRVPIPGDIQRLRDAAPDLAATWRRATRGVLKPAIDAGFQVEELHRNGPVSEYLLVRGGEAPTV